MQPQINFAPGPSQLYFTVPDHIRTALREGIPSLSHRGKSFEKIFQETTEGLRTLLNIPSSHHIFFLASATEAWERVLQNLVEHHSFHLVNGAFSTRYYETAMHIGKLAAKQEAPAGNGFEDIHVPDESELIALTHNETSTGVSMPLPLIHDLKKKYPQKLVAVDAVSSLPQPEFDYSCIDTLFFSVQKGFGLPAGLGVWIVNERCIEKAAELERKGISTGSYHSMNSLHNYALKNQTPETPNVLNIYLLNKVVQDMIRRGIQQIRRETTYKATLLYHILDTHNIARPFVHEKAIRSDTVIVCECGDHTVRVADHLIKHGMLPGEGYGTFKSNQLRFANFPTHSKEQYELLADTLQLLA